MWNLDGHTVHIGLAGFLTMRRRFWSALFGVASDRFAGSQFAGERGRRGYPGFFYTRLPVQLLCQRERILACPAPGTADGSYTGNYDVTIPEPESLALFGIGLVGLFLGRRRRV
jgi:hypothetical protein